MSIALVIALFVLLAIPLGGGRRCMICGSRGAICDDECPTRGMS